MSVKTPPVLLAIVLAVPSFALSAEPSSSEQLPSRPESCERLLPKSTLALVKIPNASEFRRKWNASSLGAMQRDPAFRPFFADVERQVDKLTGNVKSTLGVGVAEVWQSVQGELAITLVHSRESGFAFVAVGQVGEDEKAAVRLIGAIELALGTRGAIPIRLNSPHAEITSWSIGSGADKYNICYFRRGTRLIASHDLNALLEVARQAGKGPEESLYANPVYQQIVDETRALSGDPALQWYVDPIGALRTAISSNLQGNPNLGLVTGLLSSAGVDKFKGIGGSVDFASGNADTISRTFGYVELPATGLLKALKLPATHQVPPTWVKEDVNLYTQINWSPAYFFHSMGGFVDSYAGVGTFKSLIGSSQLGNTRYSYGDVANQLVGPLHIAAKMPRSTSELIAQPAVIGLGVRDSNEAGTMLRSIGEAAGEKPELIDGVPVYRMNLPAPWEGSTFQVAASVAEGTLMISLSPDYLKSVLLRRNGKRTLAGSRSYRQATGSLPEKSSMIGYQRQDWRFERLYEQLRSGKLQVPLYGMVMTNLGIDFSKLPPGSALRPYLQTSASFIEPADKGFRMIDIGYWTGDRTRPVPEKRSQAPVQREYEERP